VFAAAGLRPDWRRSCLRPPAFGRTGDDRVCGRRPSAGLADREACRAWDCDGTL